MCESQNHLSENSTYLVAIHTLAGRVLSKSELEGLVGVMHENLASKVR